MPKFIFNKLVRDKIVDKQIASGSKPSFKTLSKSELKTELIKKIIEEAEEIHKAKPEAVSSEIADVQQVLDDLIELFGLKQADIELAKKTKLAENGGFKKGLYISEIELSEHDKWVEYFRSNPDNYPEI